MRLFVFNHTLCHHKRLESQFKSLQRKNGKTFSQSCNVQKKWKNFFRKAVMCRQNEKTFLAQDWKPDLRKMACDQEQNH